MVHIYYDNETESLFVERDGENPTIFFVRIVDPETIFVGKHGTAHEHELTDEEKMRFYNFIAQLYSFVPTEPSPGAGVEPYSN